MSTRTRLVYVTDPMCSWCWGFSETLEALRGQLLEHVDLDLVMGGLAPDDERPMEPSMRRYVQSAWRAVEARCAARFNHDFWERCEPRRSTWPACRAVLLARTEGLHFEMLVAIQRAYYLEARNPALRSTLAELAAEIGFSGAFLARLDSHDVRTNLQQDLDYCAELSISAFPALVLERGTQRTCLTRGWVEAQGLQSLALRYGLLRDV